MAFCCCAPSSYIELLALKGTYTMLVIGLSLPVVRYLWSFSRSRQPLPRHEYVCLRKFAMNPLPLPTWRHGWGERPGFPLASRPLCRGTGRPMPSTHPVGSKPPRHRRMRSLAADQTGRTIADYSYGRMHHRGLATRYRRVLSTRRQ